MYKHLTAFLIGILAAFASFDVPAQSALTVGPNVNITKTSGNNVEETIAINPKNPLNLFASETWSLVTKYSLDGGLTWSNSDVSALGTSDGDVATAWDDFGNLFLVQFSSVSTLRIVVGLSTNGGASFQLLYQTKSTGNDQPSVAVGPSSTAGQGSVWVTYTDRSNQLVGQGAAVTGLGSVGSFSAAQSAPGGGGDFGDITIGPAGEVMVVYQDNNTTEGPDTLRLNLDSDGIGSGGFGLQMNATVTQVGAFATIPAQPKRLIDAEAGLAWDRGSGPYHGRLYLVYTDRASTNTYDTDIYVRYSDNEGTNWSSPVRVNDDAIGDGKSQFLPRMAIDETRGYIAVSFYDCRNSTSNSTTEVWATVSTNGGASFLPNVKVSAGVSSALAPVIASGGFDYGDYTGLTFFGGVFYPCWADNSNSTADNPNGALNYFDIYTAKVTVRTPLVMLNPRRNGTIFTTSILTTVGKNYYLESTTDLANPVWSSAPAVAGNGLVKDFTNTNAASQMFYRVREQ